MKATLINNATGERIEVRSTTRHPSCSYGVISNKTLKEILPQYNKSKFISFYDVKKMDLEQTINALCDNA